MHTFSIPTNILTHGWYFLLIHYTVVQHCLYTHQSMYTRSCHIPVVYFCTVCNGLHCTAERVVSSPTTCLISCSLPRQHVYLAAMLDNVLTTEKYLIQWLHWLLFKLWVTILYDLTPLHTTTHMISLLLHDPSLSCDKWKRLRPRGRDGRGDGWG